MPTYTVTAEDRVWFARCHRSWDLGAGARRNLQPVDPSPPDPLRDALLEAFSVHYFPGMWGWDRAIVDRLVTAAYERAGGPEQGRRLLAGFRRWAPTADRFTPIRVQVDLDVPVPDPTRPGAHLIAPDGRVVRYRHRVHLAVIDEDERCWLLEHRIVDRFADGDELILHEGGLVACWAWTETELALPAAGTQYTELRLDPPALRRTAVPRSAPAVAAAADRLGRAVIAMLAAGAEPDPSPSWSHCRACPFRAPCVVMQGGGDAGALLAAGYRPRPPDDLEEGRLGGVSWGMGRGARPVRF